MSETFKAVQEELTDERFFRHWPILQYVKSSVSSLIVSVAHEETLHL